MLQPPPTDHTSISGQCTKSVVLLMIQICVYHHYNAMNISLVGFLIWEFCLQKLINYCNKKNYVLINNKEVKENQSIILVNYFNIFLCLVYSLLASITFFCLFPVLVQTLPPCSVRSCSLYPRARCVVLANVSRHHCKALLIWFSLLPCNLYISS